MHTMLVCNEQHLCYMCCISYPYLLQEPCFLQICLQGHHPGRCQGWLRGSFQGEGQHWGPEAAPSHETLMVSGLQQVNQNYMRYCAYFPAGPTIRGNCKIYIPIIIHSWLARCLCIHLLILTWTGEELYVPLWLDWEDDDVGDVRSWGSMSARGAVITQNLIGCQ